MFHVFAIALSISNYSEYELNNFFNQLKAIYPI